MAIIFTLDMLIYSFLSSTYNSQTLSVGHVYESDILEISQSNQPLINKMFTFPDDPAVDINVDINIQM